MRDNTRRVLLGLFNKVCDEDLRAGCELNVSLFVVNTGEELLATGRLPGYY